VLDVDGAGASPARRGRGYARHASASARRRTTVASLAVAVRWAIFDQLDYLDRVAAEADVRTRAMVAYHEPDENLRCSRSRWRRPVSRPLLGVDQ
jgi:hypothetical protein